MSAFISSLPFFLFGPSEKLLGSSHTNPVTNSTGNIGYQLCNYDEIVDTCDEQSSRRTRETIPAVVLLFLGNFINGIGSTAFYIVGTPYLDDNIDKAKTPIYFGKFKVILCKFVSIWLARIIFMRLMWLLNFCMSLAWPSRQCLFPI